MAVYFVSSADGNDGDNGTTMDLAWATVEHALEAGGLNAGDYVFVRRTHDEDPAGDINPVYDGTPSNPIYTMGWPRPAIPNTTITEGDFTNGSTIVDNVVGITPSRTPHTARYITGPDGEQYMLTAVLWEAGVDGMAGGAEYTVGTRATNTMQTKYGKIYAFTDDLDTTGTIQYVKDSISGWVENDNITDAGGGDAEIDAGGEVAVGFIIDRQYVGATVTGVDGKFQIEADEFWYDDMGMQYGFDDSGWAIKEIHWDADAHDLARIDFNDAANNLNIAADRWQYLANLEFRESTAWMVVVDASASCTIAGCLFYQDNNSNSLALQNGPMVMVKRCIFEGSGSGASQRGVYLASGAAAYLQDVAIYNMGDCALYALSVGVGAFLENVNLGIEMANGDDDIELQSNNRIWGRDVALGATNGDINRLLASRFASVSIENYNKFLEAHKRWVSQGEISRVTAGSGGDIANQRSGGSANLIEILYDVAGIGQGVVLGIDDWISEVFVHEFEATTDTKSYRYYVQSMAIVTAAQLFIEAEFVAGYDDASEYVFATQRSDEAFTVRADADDWGEYMEVTNITPAVASKVRIKCYCSYQHASDKIYIDPKEANQGGTPIWAYGESRLNPAGDGVAVGPFEGAQWR